MKRKENTVSILDFNKQPFAFLEGGTGLNREENYISKGLFNRGYDVYIFDDLYENPKKLAALQFLDVKTIMLGTTGVYRDKLDVLVSLFFSLKLEKLENIILTLKTEDVMRKEMIKLKKKLPKVKFYDINTFITGSDWSECELYEIYP